MRPIQIKRALKISAFKLVVGSFELSDQREFGRSFFGNYCFFNNSSVTVCLMIYIIVSW